MEIEAHGSFEAIRPDEVAECWDGIDNELYRSLWRCVDSYTGPTPEESEEPVYGLNSVSDFWDRFTDDEKRALNDAARAQEALWGDYDEHQPDEAQEWHDFDPDC